MLTAGFLVVILGATSKGAPAGFAPLAIGLALTLIHLVSIPVTNTSVNPARSTAVAFFAQTGRPGQLWLFWVAPLLGGELGAVIWKALLDDAVESPPVDRCGTPKESAARIALSGAPVCAPRAALPEPLRRATERRGARPTVPIRLRLPAVALARPPVAPEACLRHDGRAAAA